MHADERSISGQADIAFDRIRPFLDGSQVCRQAVLRLVLIRSAVSHHLG
jgi:hypothetical protein